MPQPPSVVREGTLHRLLCNYLSRGRRRLGGLVGGTVQGAALRRLSGIIHWRDEGDAVDKSRGWESLGLAESPLEH